MSSTQLDAWRERCDAWVRMQPTADRREALLACAGSVAETLEALGFRVARHSAPDAAPVLVGWRPGRGRTLGLAGHYDVEQADGAWKTPPFSVTKVGGRLYARGIADNLGPLSLRIAALESRTAPSPSLLWVLQGEEEIGSPFAHRLYPALELPRVDLWVEETGYFELDGSQRLLARDLDAFGEVAVAAVRKVAASDSRTVAVHHRYLNKAFGQHRCPFLTHLVAGRSYLAIGPNDPRSAIHDVDESLPLSTLAVSVAQFDALLTAAAA